jgi:hypothetical protein
MQVVHARCAGLDVQEGSNLENTSLNQLIRSGSAVRRNPMTSEPAEQSALHRDAATNIRSRLSER